MTRYPIAVTDPARPRHALADVLAGMLAGVFAVSMAPGAAWPQAACMLRDAPADLPIYWNGRTPSDDGVAFPMTPASGFIVGHRGHGAIAASDYDGQIGVFQWSNRCQPLASTTKADCPGSNPRPNAPFDSEFAAAADELDGGGNAKPGQGAGMAFTSVSRADACTEAQLVNVMTDGGVEVAAPIAREAGLTVVSNHAETTPQTLGLRNGESVLAYLDVCLLPDLPDGIGAKADMVVLDYEVQDKRAPDQAEAFLTRMSDRVQALGADAGRDYPFVLWTNPANWNPDRNGLDAANGPRIASLFDLIALIPTTKFVPDLRDDLTEQLNYWGVPASKALVMYDFGERFPQIPGLTGRPERARALAQMVGAAARDMGFAGIAIWAPARLDSEVACAPHGQNKMACLLGAADCDPG